MFMADPCDQVRESGQESRSEIGADGQVKRLSGGSGTRHLYTILHAACCALHISYDAGQREPVAGKMQCKRQTSFAAQAKLSKLALDWSSGQCWSAASAENKRRNKEK